MREVSDEEESLN